MADLRGQQLKDSYQNVVTRGTGNKLDNGNGVEFADLDDKASLSDLKILQVISNTTSTSVSTTSTEPVDSGLTATIIPTSSSSKIIALVYQPHRLFTLGGADTSRGFHQLQRNGDSIAGARIGRADISSPDIGVLGYPLNISFEDSPNTTESLTYKTRTNVSDPNTTIQMNAGVGGNARISSIILIEVA